MKSIIYAACVAVIIEVTSAHLCLVNPHQRGSMVGLNTPASNDCVLLKSPCGGRPAEKPYTTLMAGKNTSVIFQKNLDHWLSATPGYFDVSILNGTTQKEILLARVPDKGEKALHLYTLTGIVPSGISDLAQLQVKYVTKNPNAPPVFYQCADVMIK